MVKSPRTLTGGKLLGRSYLLMNKLTAFYSKEENINRLLDIVNGTSKISLRIIDWFVTNYCKKNNIVYYVDKKSAIKTIKNNKINDKEQFIVFLRYKMQLKAFLKKSFDPFCRRERITFYYNDKGDSLVTTVGQLNFFKWGVENKVLDYIDNNLKDIEEDMNSNIKSNKKEDKKNLSKKRSPIKRRKRRELSKCATKTMNVLDHDITLDFN